MQHISTPHSLTRFVLALMFLALFCTPAAAFASSQFSATPVVIDGKGKDREILRYSVSVQNLTPHVVSIYPWVTDIDTKKGEEGSSDLDGSRDKELAASLARWIEVTRGSVDLLPGEKKDISITVQINLNAKPGMYHATIHLSAGGDRFNAEKNLAETTDVGMNVEVLDDINERLQLDSFLPAKNFFSGADADFSYTIENIGNRGLIPRGKIRIYDRRGIEVATVDANKDGKKLEPSTNQMLSTVWSSGNEFGRYKAMLDLEYGGHGTLQDTVFFWVIPWQKLAGMFISLIIFCVVIAIVLHSRSEAAKGRGGLGYASMMSRRKRALGLFGGRNEEEREDVYRDYQEEEAVEDHTYERNASVKELRQIPLPPPVHTRVSRMNYGNAPLELHERAQVDMASHQVVLGKREGEKISPQHIVNLKR